MRYLLLTFIYLALLPEAHSYQSSKNYSIQSKTSLNIYLKKAENLNLNKVDKEIYSALKSKSITMNDAYGDPKIFSAIKELKHGEETMGKAKALARFFLANTVKKHWKKELENTILNDSSSASFNEFYQNSLYEQLERNCTYSHSKEGTWFFQVGNWAKISVSKNFTKVNVALDIDSLSDGNQISDKI